MLPQCHPVLCQLLVGGLGHPPEETFGDPFRVRVNISNNNLKILVMDVMCRNVTIYKQRMITYYHVTLKMDNEEAILIYWLLEKLTKFSTNT